MKDKKVRNGSKVKIISNDISVSDLKVGDVGIVNSCEMEYDGAQVFRVLVDGKDNLANWQHIEEVRVLKY